MKNSAPFLATIIITASQIFSFDALYSFKENSVKIGFYPFGFLHQYQDEFLYNWNGLAIHTELGRSSFLSIKYGAAQWGEGTYGIFVGPRYGIEKLNYDGVELSGRIGIFCLIFEPSLLLGKTFKPDYNFNLGLGFTIPLLFIQNKRFKSFFTL